MFKVMGPHPKIGSASYIVMIIPAILFEINSFKVLWFCHRIIYSLGGTFSLTFEEVPWLLAISPPPVILRNREWDFEEIKTHCRSSRNRG